DADGIPDHVVAHRSKVWIFHGGAAGPQFTEPTAVLKLADEATALLLIRLDDDPYPDLLVFKVQMPSVTRLLLGVFRSLEVEVTALGYASRQGRSFSRVPTWKSVNLVRLPSLVGILRNPASLLGRVEGVELRFRRRRSADVDGDGVADTLLVDPGRTRIEVWRGRGGGGKPERLGATFRRVLFGKQRNSWDLDEILGFFVSLSRRGASPASGAAPDAAWPLRDPGTFDFLGYAAGDLDGNGREELVVGYQPLQGGGPIFDVVGMD
ncbi:MAG: hypothetical protein ACE5JG_06920, partial [Planctomycetota bacterium]